MASLDDTTNTAGHLIGAGQVQGTTVYSLNGEKLGSVEDVMIDKASGRIAYAVLTFGGFMGLGGHFYPLPWEKLRYDTGRGGYLVDVDRETLEGAPSYTADAAAEWEDDAWGRDIYNHYGSRPFWDPIP